MTALRALHSALRALERDDFQEAGMAFFVAGRASVAARAVCLHAPVVVST